LFGLYIHAAAAAMCSNQTGQVIRDDVYTVSPFKNKFYMLKNVSGSNLLEVRHSSSSDLLLL
jgi:hypothetical protein